VVSVLDLRPTRDVSLAPKQLLRCKALHVSQTLYLSAHTVVVVVNAVAVYANNDRQRWS
jgi:hypothetical protein